MVTSADLLALLAEERLMPIIRSDDRLAARAIARTVIEAGCRVLEISLTTPGALAVIGELSGLTGVEVGAGTVIRAEDAAAARDAGASFLVTPAVTSAVATGVELGLPVLAGALTPTEIVAAVDAGATAVKLFPAEFGGPAYLSALRAPLPTVPLIPVGGVTLETGRDYLERGALALGVGSPLTGAATGAVDIEALAKRAAAFRRLASGS